MVAHLTRWYANVKDQVKTLYMKFLFVNTVEFACIRYFYNNYFFHQTYYLWNSMDSINPHKSQQEQARCLPTKTQNIMNRRKKREIILGFTITQK